MVKLIYVFLGTFVCVAAATPLLRHHQRHQVVDRTFKGDARPAWDTFAGQLALSPDMFGPADLTARPSSVK